MMLTLLLLASCQTETGISEFVLLEPRAQLVRLSADLRGARPSEDELLAIEADPALYGDFVDRYLEDPRFTERAREWLNLRLLTRTGAVDYDTDGLGWDEQTIAESIGEEPLMLASFIIENDLPWSEMVLADYTRADDVLVDLWDLDDGGESAGGWRRATYTDGRPHAGILTMNATWLRYPSMGGNANRHRANAVSRMLLCDDYLARPIVVDRAAADLLTEDPEDAIHTTLSCQSCHSTLDPLAANLFGFFREDEPMDLIDAGTYRPEAETGWRDWAGLEPNYFGRPTAGPVEMAVELAEDSRFVDCAVQTFFEGISQRAATDDDWAELQLHRAAFEERDLNVRDLVRSIVTSGQYRASKVNDDALAERLATARIVSPAQLASIVEDLTGYRWTFGGRDGLTTNDLGLPVLAGWVDSASASTPSWAPSVGLVLIQERLAQSAAWHVAQHDLDPDRSGDAILLDYVTIEDTPESYPEAFDTQIRHLYLRVTGEPLGAEATEPEALMDLWKQVYSLQADPEQAWAAVVSAVLRDPQILFY